MNKQNENNEEKSSSSGWREIQQTQGFGKYQNYIQNLKHRDDFISDVEQIREEFEVGAENDRSRNNNDFKHRVENLCLKYGIDPIMCGQFMEHFVRTGNINYQSPAVSMCMTRDVEEEEADYERTKMLWDKTYPVRIYVHPQASKRDILDYVKKCYNPGIKRRLEKNKNSDIDLGSARKRSERIQKRDRFIYQHRDLKYKEISRKVAEKFDEPLDEGYIGKIISREKKKRQ
jgi:hypothetical protein